ncbi:LysR family transcriptional regulator [Lutibaculum baratangense]|uniref:Putative LysR family transcriptional regulatory protein n=1 Tax=Lutibaculum baratangense AMV1 TaxID=631454 RepID=V4RHI7_9HYPH|nr:LysR family transcriptional regulator [Lutibaculum baratangense]ESR25586.1 putative LysR family transcriptional regulatory protein [Lutibaculum baratangense AMV1]
MRPADAASLRDTRPTTAERGEAAGPNLRHLRAFCRVAELRSINRAADEIHLSQPAISQAIVRLEEEFGANLFTRSATGMTPTRMGGILRTRVERGFRRLGDAASAGDPPGAQARDPSLLFRASQLCVLIEIGRSGSLEACARTLGITEKSVGRNLRNLEERVGRPLVARDGSVLRLTQLGEIISRAAKLFFRELELAREEMAAERGVSEGRLVVGALPLARSFIVPKAMVEIAQRFPHVRLQLVEAPYPALVAGVRDGDIDVLVGALRQPVEAEDVRQHVLFSEELCVVARSDHPCLRREVSGLHDLLAYPWIAPRSGSPARREFDSLVATSPSHPTVLLEAASHIAVRSILLESDCLALISRHQIRYEEAHGQLAVVPVDLGQSPRDIGYTVHASWQPTPLQRAFLSELERTAAISLETAAAGS